MKNEFGPNQDEVDRLFERLETVEQNQALFLGSYGGDDPETERLRDRMLAAARTAGRERQLKAAQDEVTRWVNTWFSGGFPISGYGRDISPAEAALNAAPAVLDAVGALVLRDVLEREDFEALIGPWQELLARP